MVQFEKYFSFQIFFIFLRESVEIVIIVSILLTIIKQALSGVESNLTKRDLSGHSSPEEEYLAVPASQAEDEFAPVVENRQLYKRLKVQVLAGGALGLLCCLLIGSLFIFLFYLIGTDIWSLSEHYYEGVLSLLASVIISVMGLFFLQMGKIKERFRVKLASILYAGCDAKVDGTPSMKVKFREKYALFILPFVTALREGLEAVIFIGGIGLDQPLTSIPLSMLAAIAISVLFGNMFVRSSKSLSLNICLIVATCMLYLIAAGLFSKGVWQFELQHYIDLCDGQDMAEVGSGPGSYDISRSVWHVNCCNGERDGFWMLFTAFFGWTNSATYGSVISYICYWLVIIAVINLIMIEQKHGYIPFLPIRFQVKRMKAKLAMAKASLDLKHKQLAGSQLVANTEPRLSQDSMHSDTALLSTVSINTNS
ncbi:HDR045Cp [Eremothecium sinecaudum]|uniref:HDR045Cp n=1 Tax=Eremothecium sinecaudum TaxID=45286 RepID=A0A0X8HSS5_9SACH|nr:HDR045Cp [Eremothecium sinecaudum]AMD20787.1 HDR045Cp [Eremothecium sinecaudum]